MNYHAKIIDNENNRTKVENKKLGEKSGNVSGESTCPNKITNDFRIRVEGHSFFTHGKHTKDQSTLRSIQINQHSGSSRQNVYHLCISFL